MSNDKEALLPIWLETLDASIAPPAGPDSTSRIGNLLAVSRVVSPPPDVMRRNGDFISFPSRPALILPR